MAHYLGPKSSESQPSSKSWERVPIHKERHPRHPQSAEVSSALESNSGVESWEEESESSGDQQISNKTEETDTKPSCPTNQDRIDFAVALGDRLKAAKDKVIEILRREDDSLITVKSLKEFLSQAESKYRRLMKDRAQAEGEVKVLRAALTSYKAAMVISC